MVKNLPVHVGDAGDVGSIPVSGRFPGELNGNPLQYSCLENPMEREAWGDIVQGDTKSRTRLKRLSSSRLVIGEGNGNPVQYSCLENPMEREAW